MLLECGLGDTYDRIQQDRNEVKSSVCFTLIRSRLSWAKESLYVHMCVGARRGNMHVLLPFLWENGACCSCARLKNPWIVVQGLSWNRLV